MPYFTFRLVASQSPSGWWTFRWFVDPEGIQEFHLDVRFDATRVQFVDLDYVSPYVEVTPPDLGSLAAGIIRDVAGVSSIDPPPSGPVDVFFVDFRPCDCDPEPLSFIIEASSNDFVVTLDGGTGVTTLHPASSLSLTEFLFSIPAAVCIPDSHSLLLEAGVLAGMCAVVGRSPRREPKSRGGNHGESGGQKVRPSS
ncbi:MAG: hypothetical protein AB7O66_21455 [Limisphaerales bacterium]